MLSFPVAYHFIESAFGEYKVINKADKSIKNNALIDDNSIMLNNMKSFHKRKHSTMSLNDSMDSA
jgi:hypothetical protein